ncbi:thymidylate synthase [Lasallia pustulata]|uniref:Thymidylate synthase n=1 Tax=Lasallia pustulata TaxID=136370 RepID=A0A1W5DC85_9LECA|nr:thymidylate synthase [Lasallia pustulata]
MAIHPDLEASGLTSAPSAQPIDIEAWTEQATEALHAIAISSPGGVRGTSVTLAIPLDEHPASKQTDALAASQRVGDAFPVYRPRREPLRRDSLKRREALLKGKEGSRRRQRWENDRLLNNPWAQPPLPSDWEVHPTYPKHAVPYYLAPLWDADMAARSAAQKKRADKDTQPEKAPGNVPKELREKLKRAKAAKGLLQDLEEEVRKFVKRWEEKERTLEGVGLRNIDSDEEEIVFVGRNGQMHDMLESPKFKMETEEEEVKRDKLVFHSLEDDHGASFGRWLVHSIATYYGLRTWSVTVGDPARREASDNKVIMAPSLQLTEASAAQDNTAKDVSTLKKQAPANPSHEEYQYLNLIQNILDNGEHRPDRTGTGTLSLFAPPPLRFSLSRPSADPPGPPIPILPLLTTKRVFFRAVVAELLWFISGSTSSVPLSQAGIKIWDGNGSREFLDSVGLSHRDVGDLGPVYGFQWRHFGAEYVDAKTDYTGQGVDQLAEVIDKLKNKPYDRRIILSAWNPADLKKMALPPCHMFAQFYVSYPRSSATGSSDVLPPGSKSKGVLSCQLYQRSCDMGLGVPFNIASYAILTHMLAHVCDLTPGTFIQTMGDAHVYLDHLDALKVQLEREPRNFPDLVINREKGGSIDGWRAEDIEVKGYAPYKSIAMKMSV